MDRVNTSPGREQASDMKSPTPPTKTAAPRLGPASHEKGPRVFLDYDQVELDAAYTQIAYAPNAPQIIKRFTLSSQWSLARIGPPERVSYGFAEIERLDIYRCPFPKAPILMFIHGGGWRLELAKDFVFPGETFIRSGAHYVVPDFSWVQDVGGKLLPPCRPSAPCGRLGLPQRRADWGRPQSHPCRRAIIRRPSRQRASDNGLAWSVRPARRPHQRRRLYQRHVRPEAGLAFCAEFVCSIR